MRASLRCEANRRKPGAENMPGTCAAAYNRKRSGHARRPPGLNLCRLHQARFSRLGAAVATPRHDKRVTRQCNRVPQSALAVRRAPADHHRRASARIEASGRKPGVENMLGHAPPPLTASGLDLRGGHPAENHQALGSQDEVLTPRRRIRRKRQNRGRGKKFKRRRCPSVAGQTEPIAISRAHI